MYRLNERETMHGRLRALPEERGGVKRLPERSEYGMRVVRVPGGFAYVASASSPRKSQG